MSADTPAQAALRAEMQRTDGAWQDAQVARMNGQDVTLDDVIAKINTYIAASYAFQKAKWGKVQVKLSAGSLLR